MESIFYFRLHPLYWTSESDGEAVYRALSLSDGTYLVSWKTNATHETIEVLFTQEEMTQAIALGQYIITNENGEMTT